MASSGGASSSSTAAPVPASSLARASALLPAPLPRQRKVVSFRDALISDEDNSPDLDRVRSMLEDGLLEVRPERHRRQPPIIAHALSGMVGSICAELLLFPFDNIKLIIQTSGPEETNGFIFTLEHVLRTRGLSGLYKGISVSVFKESIHSMAYWLWHGLLFRHLCTAHDTCKTPVSQRLLVNLLAKQLNWLCTTPIEVISTVNQLAPDSPGFFPTAAMLYRREGLGAFYRGLAITLVLAINPAIMNTLITSLLRLVALYRMLVRGEHSKTAHDHGPAIVGCATAVSKFVATVGTYPLIRAKVLQQSSDHRQRSVTKIWRSILASEGLAGLYRGFLPMSLRTVFWNAVMMSFKHALGPKQSITPPRTPPSLDPASLVPPMPWMWREPFPAELITTEKLNEILSCVKIATPQAKVSKLETRIKELSHELSEVKLLLRKMVRHLDKGNDAEAARHKPLSL